MSSVSGRKPKDRRSSSKSERRERGNRQETHRFPKWLLHEQFTIEHRPLSNNFFSVILSNEKGLYPGHASSIAHAAKIARKLREKA